MKIKNRLKAIELLIKARETGHTDIAIYLEHLAGINFDATVLQNNEEDKISETQ